MLNSKCLRHAQGDYISVLFGSGFARAIALVNSVLIARFLGSDRFGQFNLFYIMMLFAWIIPQAFDTTFVKFAKGCETAARMPSYWRASVQLKMVYCLVVAVCAWPAGQFMSKTFFDKPQTAWLLSSGLLCGALLSIMNTVASSLQVKGNFRRYAVLQGIYAAAVCAGLIGLFIVAAVQTLAPVVVLYLSVSAVMGLVSTWMILRGTPDVWRLEPAIMRQVVHFGKWIFLTAIALYTFPRIDGLVLAKYLDLHHLGIYSAATQLTMIISVATGSLSAVFLPRSMQALESAIAFKQFLYDAARPIAIVLSGIFLLGIVAPWLIQFIYGQPYASAAGPLRIILIGYVFNIFYQPLSFLFYTMDRPQFRFALEAGKMLLVLYLFAQFIPTWGMVGAAASMATAMTVNFFLAGTLLFVFLRRHHSGWHQPSS